MKAEELRIGNYLLNDNCIVRVEHIMFSDYCLVKTKQNNSITARYELIKPIPLTEEWLLKFGFVKNKISNEWHFGEFSIWKLSPSDPSKSKIILNLMFDIDNPEIKSVHQLQNIYFALTGEELTIKP